MDHAEAHERIADLALDRDAIARLEAGGLDDQALLDHVRGCAACTADMAAVRILDQELRNALGAVSDAAAVQPIHPPDSLRGTVLSAVRREPRAVAGATNVVGATSPGAAPAGTRPGAAGVGSEKGHWGFALPRLSGSQWAASLAAALVIALLGGLVGRAIGPAGSTPDPAMVAAMATLDRILSAPDQRIVALTAPTGTASGSVAWSSQDFVVLTSALAPPEAGRVYRCWLQWSGRWAAVGVMDFAGATAYWTGSTGDWAALIAEAGTRFVVTAEAAGTPGDAPSGAALLQASLGS